MFRRHASEEHLLGGTRAMRSFEGLNTVPATRSSLASPAHLPPHLSPLAAPQTHWLLSVSHTCHFLTSPRGWQIQSPQAGESHPSPLCPVNTHSSFEPQRPAHRQEAFPAALPTPSRALTVPHSSPLYSLSQLTGICVTTDHGPPPPWTTGQWG